MTDDPLYRRSLLRLAADAHGAGHLPGPDGVGTAHNPACGDRVTVEVALADGRVAALAHDTQACILTQASVALLAQAAVGQDRAGLERLSAALEAMLAGGPPPAPGYDAFDGVASHAGRHVCVLLPVRAALTALEDAEEGRARAQGQAAS
jgi:NifU-like protein involved in Fe-S cluster formation